MHENADKKYYGYGQSYLPSNAGDRRGRPDQPPVSSAPKPRSDVVNQQADDKYYRDHSATRPIGRAAATQPPRTPAPTTPISVLSVADARAAKDLAIARLKAGSTAVHIDAVDQRVQSAVMVQLDLAQSRNELSADLRRNIHVNVVAVQTPQVAREPAAPEAQPTTSPVVVGQPTTSAMGAVDPAKAPVADEQPPLPKDLAQFVKGEEDEDNDEPAVAVADGKQDEEDTD